MCGVVGFATCASAHLVQASIASLIHHSHVCGLRHIDSDSVSFNLISELHEVRCKPADALWKESQGQYKCMAFSCKPLRPRRLRLA